MIYSKIKTFFWYLTRPKLYLQFAYSLSKKLFQWRIHFRDTHQEALSWCALRAVDTNTAILKLTGLSMSEPVMEKFPDIFALARQRALECPVKMAGSGNLDLLYCLAEYWQVRNVIETGVAYGWSSLTLLLSLRSRMGSKLISTDMPYRAMNNDKYVGCVVPSKLRSYWCILKYADRQGIPKALGALKRIDMCHYDSDKIYIGRMWAYPKLWKALRPGGIFVSDDIGDNVAFRDFTALAKVEPIVIEWNKKYIGVAIKPL